MSLRYLGMMLMALFCSLSIFAKDRGTAKAATDVVGRILKESNIPVKLSIVKNKDLPFFEYSVKDGVLHIKGNTGVALCRGFYDYAKKNNLGVYSWTGTNLKLPKSLPSTEAPVRIESPFMYNYYLNAVTFGYSTPYWDWARWEREIDWMAVHGIDMPLALIANEAIMAKVYKKFGFSEKEINEYFVGPAHLPFSRMGLMENLDGPLDEDWYKRTIELQHRVLDRMKSLGMKPICPAFAGFVPERVKELYPDVEVVKTHWGGAFNNWMISPEDPLFSELSTAYIKEWEKEFGKCEYYLSDSFNEMEIPFPPKEDPERYELLSRYGDVVYQSIKRASPDANWVMQGWMFGYQRHIWDYNTLEALLSKVPKGKILLLDLAVDYNKHYWKSELNWDYYKGFFGQPWVYSTIPNMGGKVGWTGVLEFYANGHIEALNSKNRGNLVAYGNAPEGIENNEVIYELISDARWSKNEINLRDWLKSYSKNRYGGYSDKLDEYWNGLLGSVYGSFTDHPRYNWQFRPGLSKRGSINANDQMYRAIEAFASDANRYTSNKLYEADLIEATALYVGAKIQILTNIIESYYIDGDLENGDKYLSQFNMLMMGLDKVLSKHPVLKLEDWIKFAENAGATPMQKRQFVKNAKRIVTIWGPPVDDYSARIWSGLVRDYYLPRWNKYFESCRNGTSYNISEWEKDWVDNGTMTIQPTCDNVVEVCKNLIDLSQSINQQQLSNIGGNLIGRWSKADISEDGKVLSFSIPATDLKSIRGIRFVMGRNKAPITIANIRVDADGNSIFSLNRNLMINAERSNYLQKISIPEGTQANNNCQIIVTIKGGENADSSGEIYIVL